MLRMLSITNITLKFIESNSPCKSTTSKIFSFFLFRKCIFPYVACADFWQIRSSCSSRKLIARLETKAIFTAAMQIHPSCKYQRIYLSSFSRFTYFGLLGWPCWKANTEFSKVRQSSKGLKTRPMQAVNRLNSFSFSGGVGGHVLVFGEWIWRFGCRWVGILPRSILESQNVWGCDM